MRIGGSINTNTQGNPAAGADWTYTFPAGLHHLLAVAFVFVTSAAVANRGVSLVLKDAAGNILGKWGANFAQAASLTLNYSGPAFGSGQTDPNGNFGAVVIPFPEHLQVAAGYTLSSSTSNIQAADQYSAIHVATEDWAQ